MKKLIILSIFIFLLCFIRIDNKSYLKQIDLSKTNISSINNFTFKKCKQLEQILFNDKITSIGEEAFSYSNLKQFFSPSSLEVHKFFSFLDLLFLITQLAAFNIFFVER